LDKVSCHDNGELPQTAEGSGRGLFQGTVYRPAWTGKALV